MGEWEQSAHPWGCGIPVLHSQRNHSYREDPGDKIITSRAVKHKRSIRSPRSQDNPCFCSPLSLFQDFSCNVLHFCHPSLVLAEKRRRPSSCRNRCGCAKAQAGVGKGNSLFPQSPGKQGENFLLEFPLHGQLIPLGAGSDCGDAQRGQDTGAEASGTRTSCELLANPRSLCLVPAPEDPTGI